MTTIHGLCERVRTTSFCRLRRPVFICGVTVFAAFAICAGGGLRLNATGSLPLGFYVVSSGREANLVDFCPPEPFSAISVARGYRTVGGCSDGDSPLMKPVVAKAGDTVVASELGISVNGALLRNTAPRPKDSQGRPLPHHPFGTYSVAPGTVWVASIYNPLSFDSRYFGPISINQIRERLKPFLTL
jgi:conjugative transfer signal peptidase TraF